MSNVSSLIFLLLVLTRRYQPVLSSSESPADSTRATARREQEQGSVSRQSQQRPRYLNKGDAYLLDRVPGWKPQTEEEFKASLKNTFGDKVTDDNIHEYIQAYNTAVDQVIQGPGVNVMGVSETVPLSFFSLGCS